jgi:hypothetical protein
MAHGIEKAGYICQPRLDRWNGGIVTGWGETECEALAKMVRGYGLQVGDWLPREDCNIVPASSALLGMLNRSGGHCGTRHVMLNGVACTVSEVQDLRRDLEAAHNATGATLGYAPAF